MPWLASSTRLSRWSRCSSGSARVLSARSVRCTCSGAVSTLPLPASQGAARRSIPAALPDAVTREAYSHEVSSAGFWPGGGGTDFPAFYSYAYPAPNGFGDAPPGPEGAYFDRRLGEFLLPYDAVRQSSDP